MTFIGLKDAGTLEVWAAAAAGPWAFVRSDRARAAADGRTSLGGVASGNVSAILAPTDLRARTAAIPPGAPAWTADLYAELTTALATLRRASPVDR